MAYREKDTKKWTAQWFETNVMGEKKKRRNGIMSGKEKIGRLQIIMKRFAKENRKSCSMK